MRPVKWINTVLNEGASIMTPLEMMQDRVKCRDAMRAIDDTANDKNRSLTKAERTKFDEHQAEYDRLTFAIADKETDQARQSKLHAMDAELAANHVPAGHGGRSTQLGWNGGRGAGDPVVKPKPAAWVNCNTGEPMQTFQHGENLADAYGRGDAPEIGELIAGLVSGNMSKLDIKSAVMGGSTSSGGGYLVTDAVSAKTLDVARAQAAVSRVGATTIPWDGSDSLRIARVESDPSMEIKAENAAFTEAALTLGGVTLTAHTIGAMIVSSRELFEDASGAAMLVQQVLGKALATELDRLAMVGSGSSEPTGLVLQAGNTKATGGAVVYTDYLDAYSLLETDNFTPDFLIHNPVSINTLRGLLIASEANHYTPVPTPINELNTIVSSAMPTANNLMGVGSAIILGVRQGARLEVTDVGDTAFSKHQVRVKITFRGDIGVSHANAVASFTGITA